MTSTATLRGHAPAAAGEAVVATDIPARLDRLRWGRFHTLVVVALGITWILDGLEVTLAGAVAPALKESPQLQFSNAEVGLVSSAYLAGAVLGALFFGWLTDRLGRKRLFDSHPGSMWPRNKPVIPSSSGVATSRTPGTRRQSSISRIRRLRSSIKRTSGCFLPVAPFFPPVRFRGRSR